MAYFAGIMVPRVCVYSAWRKQGNGSAAFTESSDRMVPDRSLAWGKLELCSMGALLRVILITEKYFTGKILAKLPEAVQTLYTMILVMLGWVLFFSPTLGSALTWIGNMFGQGATGFMDSQALYLIMRNWLFWVAGIIGSTPFMHLLGKRLVFNEERPHTVLAGCLMTGLFVLCVAYLVTESYNPFLYFRF